MSEPGNPEFSPGYSDTFDIRAKLAAAAHGYLSKQLGRDLETVYIDRPSNDLTANEGDDRQLTLNKPAETIIYYQDGQVAYQRRMATPAHNNDQATNFETITVMAPGGFSGFDAGSKDTNPILTVRVSSSNVGSDGLHEARGYTMYRNGEVHMNVGTDERSMAGREITEESDELQGMLAVLAMSVDQNGIQNEPLIMLDRTFDGQVTEITKLFAGDAPNPGVDMSAHGSDEAQVYSIQTAEPAKQRAVARVRRDAAMLLGPNQAALASEGDGNRAQPIQSGVDQLPSAGGRHERRGGRSLRSSAIGVVLGFGGLIAAANVVAGPVADDLSDCDDTSAVDMQATAVVEDGLRVLDNNFLELQRPDAGMLRLIGASGSGQELVASVDRTTGQVTLDYVSNNPERAEDKVSSVTVQPGYDQSVAIRLGDTLQPGPLADSLHQSGGHFVRVVSEDGSANVEDCHINASDLRGGIQGIQGGDEDVLVTTQLLTNAAKNPASVQSAIVQEWQHQIDK